jgi:ribulose-phosphate 3-epimerase
MQSSKLRPHFACSVISGNPRTFFGDISILEGSGIESYHFDMMDGDFVPRFGLYPEFLQEIRKLSALPIDVHMMLRNPEFIVDVLAEAGATTLTSHIEPLEHVHRFIDRSNKLDCLAGLALNPGTPIHLLEPVITELDSVTLMAINPGIVGHKFITSTLQKIEEMRKLILQSGRLVEIVVDGGVVPDNARQIFDAGADKIVCGAGTVFKSGKSINENMKELLGKFESE